MKRVKLLGRLLFLFGALLFLRSLPAGAQTGAVEFTVRITPSAGLAEPVRGLPLYLLRKSFAHIQKQADVSLPQPNLDKFIQTLKGSAELKAWMQKHQSVTLNGEAFLRSLTPDAILNVPEFWNAYLENNLSIRAFGFPMPKYQEINRKKHPRKYAREEADYKEKVRRFLVLNPQSKDSMDLMLNAINPAQAWDDKVGERNAAVRRLALDLSQSKYLVAQTETDVNGRGRFGGLAPGTYWISSLEIEGQVGDTREKWDVPVTIEADRTTRAMLSNYNAVPPAKPIP